MRPPHAWRPAAMTPFFPPSSRADASSLRSKSWPTIRFAENGDRHAVADQQNNKVALRVCRPDRSRTGHFH